MDFPYKTTCETADINQSDLSGSSNVAGADSPRIDHSTKPTLHEKPYMQRKMKSLAALVLYCITFSIILVFFYPIFTTERQVIDPVMDGRDNKASLVLGRQAPAARSRYGTDIQCVEVLAKRVYPTLIKPYM
jgi:hypothetical protein